VLPFNSGTICRSDRNELACLRFVRLANERAEALRGLRVVSASYYREQASVFDRWASAASDPAVALSFRQRASEYRALAQALEADDPRNAPPPTETRQPVVQQQQQIQPKPDGGKKE
jgi:hypothetical protein